jgi:hypothetical protein
MYGSLRVTLLDRALTAGSRIARIARTAVELAAGQTRWGLTDLYAVVMTARFLASHELIEQTADLVDDDTETVAVAARTWPWLGATYVYEENDQ